MGRYDWGIDSHAAKLGHAEQLIVAPDASICADCLRELFDKKNRRFRYPFINCTNCGPRFTITKDIPYDRPNTTMSVFQMCGFCQSEYDNPLDRRFHAQPNACRDCGAIVWFQVKTVSGSGRIDTYSDEEAILDQLKKEKEELKKNQSKKDSGDKKITIKTEAILPTEKKKPEIKDTAQ